MGRRNVRSLLVLIATSLALNSIEARPAVAVGGLLDMYVTGDVSNTVRVYTGATGSYLGILTPTTHSPLGIHFGPLNGRVLVGGFNGMFEFDAATGAFIKSYGPVAWQWAGVYAPNGNVFVTSTLSDQLIEYDSVTGGFVQVKTNIPGGPADMAFGPNGNLYVCQYGGNGVVEVDPTSGAIVSSWSLPGIGRGNDVAFLNGEILVTALGTNQVFRFDSTPAHNFLGSFSGTGWGNTHGIAISPHDGHIYVVDGVSAQVHKFDPLTFVEVNAAVLTPAPGDKVVDLDFRRDERPTVSVSSSWGRIKALYR
ncbi:MAG: hypothetical protein HOP12_03515 [Candidatus Eisenbacteria bacterium]|uniref:SMP-30/Gluconolactonase/LRE-like region domain-containing protein n=1 Tax=Eiseniibacteriota bacterium TaxID=2212470 RepID=A0A849SVM5_UNCEI|nr:hypothetical protein [Candidatus Eisenbacteria bacterium]